MLPPVSINLGSFFPAPSNDKLLKMCFGQPQYKRDQFASREMVDNYIAFMRDYSSRQSDELLKSGIQELSDLLEMGGKEGQKQSLYFLSPTKQMALWIDEAQHKVYILDVSEKGMSSDFSYQETSLDKLRANMAREDTYTQLFREYSNLTAEEIEVIRNSAADQTINSSAQYILSIEDFLGRAADKLRSPIDEPELFMKTNRRIPSDGGDFLKLLTVFSHVVLESKGLANRQVKLERQCMKLFWHLDLLQRNFTGEVLDELFLEGIINSVARSAAKLAQEGRLSENDVCSISEQVRGYQTLIAQKKRIPGGQSGPKKGLLPDRIEYPSLGRSFNDVKPLPPLSPFISSGKEALEEASTLRHSAPPAAVGELKKFQEVVRTGNAADIQNSLDTLLKKIQALAKTDACLAREEFMQVLLALPRPNRQHATIWDSLDEKGAQAFSKTLSHWMQAIPAIFEEERPRGPVAYYALYAIIFNISQNYFHFAAKENPHTESLVGLLQWLSFSVKRGVEHQFLWDTAHYLLPDLSMELLLTKQSTPIDTIYAAKDFKFELMKGVAPALLTYKHYALPLLSPEDKAAAAKAVRAQLFMNLYNLKEGASLQELETCFLLYTATYDISVKLYGAAILPLGNMEFLIAERNKLNKEHAALSKKWALLYLEPYKLNDESAQLCAKCSDLQNQLDAAQDKCAGDLVTVREELVRSKERFDYVEKRLAKLPKKVKQATEKYMSLKEALKSKNSELAAKLAKHFAVQKAKLEEVPFDELFENGLKSQNGLVNETMVALLLPSHPDPVHQALYAAATKCPDPSSGPSAMGLFPTDYRAEEMLRSEKEGEALNVDYVYNNYYWRYSKRVSKNLLVNARVNPLQAIDNFCNLLNLYDIEGENNIGIDDLEQFRALILGFGVPLQEKDFKPALSRLLSVSQSFVLKMWKDPDYRDRSEFQTELYKLIHEVINTLYECQKIEGASRDTFFSELDTHLIEAVKMNADDDEAEKYDMRVIRKSLFSCYNAALSAMMPLHPFKAYDKYEQKRLLQLSAGVQLALFAKDSNKISATYAEQALAYVEFGDFSDVELTEWMNGVAAPFYADKSFDASSTVWENRPRYLVCPKLNVKMDKATGKFSEINKTDSYIPLIIKQHRTFQQAFAGLEPSVECLGDSSTSNIIFRFSHPNSSVVLSYSGVYSNHEKKIFLDYQGQSYQYLPSDRLQGLAAILPSLAIDDAKISVWQSLDAPGKGNLLFLENLNKPLFQGEIVEGEVVSLSRPGKPHECAVDAAIIQHPFSLPGHYPVECWAERESGQIKSVEIPWSRFSFRVDALGLYHWKENEDFTICEEIPGELPPFLSSQPHIVLQDGEGQRKVLCLDNPSDILEVDISQEGLTSPQRFGQLKLAQGYLQEHKFDLAIAVLKDPRLADFNTTSPQFSEQEQQLVTSLLKEEEQSKAMLNSLHAAALLRVYYAQSRNAVNYPKPASSASSAAIDIQKVLKELLPVGLYSRYIKDQQRLGDLGFNEGELKFVSACIEGLIEVQKKALLEAVYQKISLSNDTFLGRMVNKILRFDLVKRKFLAFIEASLQENIGSASNVNKAIRRGTLLPKKKIEAQSFFNALFTACLSALLDGRERMSLLDMKMVNGKEAAIIGKFRAFRENPLKIDIAAAATSPKQPHLFFVEHYFALYKIATEGTLEERKHLKTILSFSNSHLEKTGIKDIFLGGGTGPLCPELVVLTRVAKDPKKFPTIQSLDELYILWSGVQAKADQSKRELGPVIEKLRTYISEFKEFNTEKYYADEIAKYKKEIQDLKEKEKSFPTGSTDAQWQALRENKRESKTKLQMLELSMYGLKKLQESAQIFMRKEGPANLVVRDEKDLNKELLRLEKLMQQANAAAATAHDKLIGSLGQQRGIFHLIIVTIAKIFSRAMKSYRGLFKSSDTAGVKKLSKRAQAIPLFPEFKFEANEKTVAALKQTVAYDMHFDKFFGSLRQYFIVDTPSVKARKKWVDARIDMYRKQGSLAKQREVLTLLMQLKYLQPSENSEQTAIELRTKIAELVKEVKDPLQDDLLRVFDDPEQGLPEGWLEKHFCELYSIAREGTSNEKRALEELLLAKGENLDEGPLTIEKALPHLLLRLIENADLLPAIDLSQDALLDETCRQIAEKLGQKRPGHSQLDKGVFSKSALQAMQFNAKQAELLHPRVDAYNTYRLERSRDKHLFKEQEARGKMLANVSKKIESEELRVTRLEKELQEIALLYTSAACKLRQVSEGGEKSLDWLKKMIMKGGVALLCTELGVSKEEAEKIALDMARYLIVSTRLQQLCRLREMLGQEPSPTANEIYQALAGMKRAYRVFENGEAGFSKLCFEFSAGYMIRQDQMQAIEKILKPSAGVVKVLEAGTGFGKTTTIVPVAARAIAESTGKLVILCWPAALIQENARDVATKFAKAFGSPVSGMFFERNSKLSAQKLQLIYEDLLYYKKEKIPVNLTADVLKAFSLHYRTLLDDLYLARKQGGINLEELELQANYFAKTLGLFKKDAVIFVDESHETLHPIDRLIYSIGGEKSLPPSLLKYFHNVMETFLGAKIGGKPVEELLKSEGDSQMGQHKESIQQQMIDALMQGFGFLDQADKQDKTRVAKYITTGSPNPFVGKNAVIADEPLQKKVYLLKGLFADGIFSEVLDMSHNENYGLPHKHLKNYPFAIPYNSAQTPTESETGPSQYANHHKTMFLTYLAYFKEGLRGGGDVIEQYQVYDFMSSLLKHATEQKKILKIQGGNRQPSIRQTEAYKFFQQHAPAKYKEVLTLKGMERLTLEDIKNIHEAMATNREVLMRYIERTALQKIKVYPESLNCTFANFLSLFGESIAMSATPMDAKSYRCNAEFFAAQNTSNQALERMLLHTVNDGPFIDSIAGGSSREVLNQVEEVIEKTADCCALIDLAGLFKDISNEEVAKTLAAKKLDPAIDRVTFYDKKEGFMRIPRHACGAIQKDDVKALQPRFAYFDQPRAIGSDIKLKKEGTAIILVTPDIPITKVAQAVGRMRQLGMNQKFRFVVPQNLLVKKELTKERLIAHWELELHAEETSRNTMSIQQQTDDIIQSALQKVLVDLPVGEMDYFYNANRKFFVSPIDVCAKNLYGSETSTVKGVDVAIAYVKEKIGEIPYIKGVNRQVKKEIFDKLKEMEGALKKMKLKETIQVGANTSGTFQSQQQVQVQTQQQANEKMAQLTLKAIMLADTGKYVHLAWSDSLGLKRTFTPHQKQTDGNKILFRSVAEAFARSENKEIKAIDKLFDAHLLVSINFWHENQVLYGSKQKPFHSYFVQMDEKKSERGGEKTFTVTLLDETEARHIEQRLHAGEVGAGTAKVALFNLENGSQAIVGNEKWSEEELNHPALSKLTAQVKLLSGNFAYALSDAEENSLRNNAYLQNKAHKETFFKFLRQIVRRKEDLAAIEHADRRLRLALPQILQVLERGIAEE